jgi:hypothetical protein
LTIIKDLDFTYLMQPPNKYTFKQPRLKKWVEDNCEGEVLNLFAGIVLLNVKETRVDIDETTNPDFCMDAYDFVLYCIENNIKFDTILLDPPYNLRKSREKYEGRYIGSLTKIKNLLPNILNDNGVIIALGYDTVGMGKRRGFKKEAICLICHSGDHNDTLCLKERKL